MDEDEDQETPQRALTPAENYANGFAALRRLGMTEEQILALKRPSATRPERG